MLSVVPRRMPSCQSIGEWHMRMYTAYACSGAALVQSSSPVRLYPKPPLIRTAPSASASSSVFRLPIATLLACSTSLLSTPVLFPLHCTHTHSLIPRALSLCRSTDDTDDDGDRDVALLGSENDHDNGNGNNNDVASSQASPSSLGGRTELWGGTGRCGAMRARTWIEMVVIGVLLTMHNFCMFAGSRDKFVAGPLLVLLEQAVVPVTMVVSDMPTHAEASAGNLQCSGRAWGHWC